MHFVNVVHFYFSYIKRYRSPRGQTRGWCHGCALHAQLRLHSRSAVPSRRIARRVPAHSLRALLAARRWAIITSLQAKGKAKAKAKGKAKSKAKGKSKGVG